MKSLTKIKVKTVTGKEKAALRHVTVVTYSKTITKATF